MYYVGLVAPKKPIKLESGAKLLWGGECQVFLIPQKGLCPFDGPNHAGTVGKIRRATAKHSSTASTNTS